MIKYSPQTKAQVVEWFIEYRMYDHVTTMYLDTYGDRPPRKSTVEDWYAKFKQTGSILDRPRSGRPRISDEKFRQIKVKYQVSPKTSTREAAREIGISRETVRTVLRYRLRFYPYKIQLMHALKHGDQDKRRSYAAEMLNELDSDENFLKRIVYSDESLFHLSGKVHRYNTRIWGRENPHEFVELIRDSPKIMLWCAMTHKKILCTFIFNEPTVCGGNYLDMLEQYAFPMIKDGGPNCLDQDPNRAIFMQDGASPHFSLVVRDSLNRNFPQSWLGRGSGGADWREWPARSPDLTPMDFFLWGYVKTKVYTVPIRDIAHLKQRILEAIASVTPDMLENVWRELEWRLDVCRATGGGHIELR